MISVAMAALFEMGVAEPRQHILLAGSDRIATLILSPEPLSAAVLDALDATIAEMDFTSLIDPRRVSEEPVLEQIIGASSREELERVSAAQMLDMTPSTDNRPFFFNQLPLHDPVRTIRLAFVTGEAGVIFGNLFATATLLILFLISTVLVLATIVVPLRPAIRDVGRRLAWGGTAYFSLIGMGFMLVEIGLLQRMSVFLGHPIYALSFVLFSIILTTGLGSLLSDRWLIDRPSRLYAWAAALGAYILALPLWLPGALAAFDSSGLAVRAGICVLTIAPAGLLMGFGFPTGMRLIAAVDRRPTPWFWGINGAAGVMAAAMAAASSIAFGIGTTFVLGAVCYLLLVPAALVIGFPAADPASARRTPAAAE